MKNLIMASVIALASTLPFAAPSSAASVTVTTVDRVNHRSDHRVMHRHRPHCIVKKVKVRSHGRVVIKTTKVCR